MNHVTTSVSGWPRCGHRASAHTVWLAVAFWTLTSQAQTAAAERTPGATDGTAPNATPGQAAVAPEPAGADIPPSGQAPASTATNGATTASVASPQAAPDVVPAPPASTAAPPTTAAIDDAAISAQAEQAANEIASASDSSATKLNIYGFSDFTFAKRLSTGKSDILMPNIPTFYVGNFNVYLSAERGRWRTLSEVRFTYLPDGVEKFNAASGTMDRTSTAYADYADWGRARKVGGVIIERVWLEYSAHQLLTIQAGQFLTPYGIWNVDHGSPVVIGVTRPFIVGNEWLPARQTGLQAYGSYGIGSTTLGYHLTLSNGRGPIDSYQDLDSNKAIGWRFWAKHDSPVGAITLGTSGYRGRYTDRTTTFSLANGVFTSSNPETARYEELSLAADLKWAWGGYLLQGEAIVHDVKYDDRLRPPPPFSVGGTEWSPDSRVWGYYALTGYRFDWYGIMPFFLNQYQSQGKGNALTVWEFSGGLNIRPNDMVVLKVAGLWLWRPDPGQFSKTESQFATQVAWSF